jgi:ubiquinone/menaquinone biosynthesis C-methylase UbiE
MTPDMINLANENKVKMGAENVEFRLAQIDKTGIDTDSVDVIISNCVIVLAPDKDAVFRESVRILKKGGRMHISDVMLTSELPDHVSSDMDNWTHCLAGAELTDVYIGRMRESGFSRVEVVSDVPYRWESEENWVASVRSVNLLATK